MMAPNTGKGGTPAYASMWSRVISQEVGHVLQLELADRTTFIGRLERVEDGRAVVAVDGRVRVVSLDLLLAVEEVEGDE